MQQNYWKWPYFSAVDKLIMYGNGYSLNLKPMLFIFKSLFENNKKKPCFSPPLAQRFSRNAAFTNVIH